MKMEVAEHFIGSPTANEADDVGVDLGEEKSHGTPCVKGPGGNVGREEAEGRTEGMH